MAGKKTFWEELVAAFKDRKVSQNPITKVPAEDGTEIMPAAVSPFDTDPVERFREYCREVRMDGIPHNPKPLTDTDVRDETYLPPTEIRFREPKSLLPDHFSNQELDCFRIPLSERNPTHLELPPRRPLEEKIKLVSFGDESIPKRKHPVVLTYNGVVPTLEQERIAGAYRALGREVVFEEIPTAKPIATTVGSEIDQDPFVRHSRPLTYLGGESKIYNSPTTEERTPRLGGVRDPSWGAEIHVNLNQAPPVLLTYQGAAPTPAQERTADLYRKAGMAVVFEQSPFVPERATTIDRLFLEEAGRGERIGGSFGQFKIRPIDSKITRIDEGYTIKPKDPKR